MWSSSKVCSGNLLVADGALSGLTIAPAHALLT